MNEFIQTHEYTVSLRLRTLHPNSNCFRFIHLAYQIEFFSQFSSFCRWIIFSWYLKSFGYIWNLTLLILQAGNIETNSGPRRIDPNHVLCAICSKKVNEGPNLKAAATCYDQYCKARCYLHCNSLIISKNWHAKTMEREIRWSCPPRGNGIAEIIAHIQTSHEH